MKDRNYQQHENYLSADQEETHGFLELYTSHDEESD